MKISAKILKKAAMVTAMCIMCGVICADGPAGEPVRKILDSKLWIETVDEGQPPKISIAPQFKAGRYNINIEMKTRTVTTFSSSPDSQRIETGSQSITIGLIAGGFDADGVNTISMRYEKVRIEASGEVGQAVRGKKSKVINIQGDKVVPNPLERIARQMISSSIVRFKIDRSGRLLEDSISSSPDMIMQNYILMVNELMLFPKIGVGGQIRTTEKSETNNFGRIISTADFKLRKIRETTKSKYALLSVKNSQEPSPGNISGSRIKSSTGKGTITIDLGDGLLKKVKKNDTTVIETVMGNDTKTIEQTGSLTITTTKMD